METLVAPNDTKSLAPKYAGQRMEKANFLAWQSDDAFVYEWNKGILEPTAGMKQEELYIIQRICRKFTGTSAYSEYAELIPEIDCWVTESQMRRPDLAYYTAEQIKQAATGESVLPAFVVEIISQFDDLTKVEKKLLEYFRAGVQVVWRVIPEIKTVYVFTSPKTVTICTDEDLISAAPVIPDLQLTVAALFTV